MAKILIVDDDPDVVTSVSMALRNANHDVTSADNREDGLAAFEKETPDLLILDVMMDQPDDGIQMARDLRRRGATCPIIMLTSIGKVTGMDFDRDSEMVPVDCFIEKPIGPKELLAKVAELLND